MRIWCQPRTRSRRECQPLRLRVSLSFSCFFNEKKRYLCFIFSIKFVLSAASTDVTTTTTNTNNPTITNTNTANQTPVTNTNNDNDTNTSSSNNPINNSGNTVTVNNKRKKKRSAKRGFMQVLKKRQLQGCKQQHQNGMKG